MGTVLTTLGTDLQSVQDALDAIEPGSAVMIPAGTYSGNEPLGGLVLDNRLLVGRGADETILDGVVNVQAFARTINTAGIADLTLRADYVCLCGADPSEYEPESVSYGDLAGRFLVWNVAWTGNETETMPVFDEETNALITPGEFGGEFDLDPSSVRLLRLRVPGHR